MIDCSTKRALTDCFGLKTNLHFHFSKHRSWWQMSTKAQSVPTPGMGQKAEWSGAEWSHGVEWNLCNMSANFYTKSIFNMQNLFHVSYVGVKDFQNNLNYCYSDKFWCNLSRSRLGWSEFGSPMRSMLYPNKTYSNYWSLLLQYCTLNLT